MNNELLQTYTAIRLELKALEEKEKLLKQQVLNELIKNKIDKITSDFGTFTVCKKTSWAYTDSVKKIEERLKLARVREQEKGLATPSIIEYVMFKENEPD